MLPHGLIDQPWCSRQVDVEIVKIMQYPIQIGEGMILVDGEEIAAHSGKTHCLLSLYALVIVAAGKGRYESLLPLLSLTRFNRVPPQIGHRTDHRGRIETAAQASANWHIATHP